MPTEKLDNHVDGDCPFRKVACNHCREEIAAKWLDVRLIWTYCIHNCMCSDLSEFCSSYPGSSEPVPKSTNEVWEMS